MKNAKAKLVSIWKLTAKDSEEESENKLKMSLILGDSEHELA